MKPALTNLPMAVAATGILDAGDASLPHLLRTLDGLMDAVLGVSHQHPNSKLPPRVGPGSKFEADRIPEAVLSTLSVLLDPSRVSSS
jgi:hypothetical protein